MSAASSAAEVEQALLQRWPESRLEPSLERVRALTDALGRPQHAVPVLHGAPIDAERFADVHARLRPVIDEVNAATGTSLSFFEVVTAMSFLAPAEADLDVVVLEVGMGGIWDATNVADGRLAVVTPIFLDHTEYLGPDGQELDLRALRGVHRRLHLPLLGRHQAGNTAVTLTAAEVFLPPRCRLLDTGTVRSVLAALAGKDVHGLLHALRGAATELVVTQTSSPRRMSAEELGRLAGALESAVQRAATATDTHPTAVLVTSSAVTAAEARALLTERKGATR